MKNNVNQLNKMEDIADMFNLELGEIFKIEGYESEYKFTELGLFVHNKAYKTWSLNEPMFLNLLLGKCRVVKIPWVPLKGDFYLSYSGGAFKLKEFEWHGSCEDYLRLNAGIVYKPIQNDVALELKDKYKKECETKYYENLNR